METTAMSVTTIIGIVGGLAMVGAEYWSTGQISPERLTEAFAFAGLGFFAQDGKIFVPLLAKTLNFGLDKATGKEKKEEEVKEENGKILSPSILPNRDRTGEIRQRVSDKTKLKRIE
jgi:hypothetical protein